MKTTLTDGSPVTADHREINPESGQQKGYVVLSEDERAKGFVRPVRRTYIHVGVGGSEIDPHNPTKHGLKGNGCGVATTMSLSIAETYARDPHFYSGTFCASCRTHFPVGLDGEFVWADTNERVGT